MGSEGGLGESQYELDGLVVPLETDIDNSTIPGIAIQSEQSMVRWKQGVSAETLVVGFNDTSWNVANVIFGQPLWANGTTAMGWAYSNDGGANWSHNLVSVPAGLGVLRSDPWLAIGNPLPIPGYPIPIYYAYIGTPPNNPDTLRYLVIASSTDGGATFPYVAVNDMGAASVPAACRTVDRITFDAKKGGGASRYYASWQNTGGNVCVATAASYAGPWTVTALPACDPEYEDWWRGSTHVQVAPNGDAYVVVEEADTLSDDYNLCIFKRNAATGAWANLGFVAEALEARPLQPAFNGSNMRLPQHFSFDISSSGLLGVAYLDQVSRGNPSANVDHVFYVSDADGVPPWGFPVEVSYWRREHQLQPTLSSEGDYKAVTYYETVSGAGDPDLETTLRVVGGVQDQLPSVAFTRVVLSATTFDPCPTTTGNYFGDYISMTVLPRAGRDQLGSVWADSRDVCESQGGITATRHQHTYGALWQ